MRYRPCCSLFSSEHVLWCRIGGFTYFRIQHLPPDCSAPFVRARAKVWNVKTGRSYVKVGMLLDLQAGPVQTFYLFLGNLAQLGSLKLRQRFFARQGRKCDSFHMQKAGAGAKERAGRLLSLSCVNLKGFLRPKKR